jgi:hypothetical protein
MKREPRALETGITAALRQHLRGTLLLPGESAYFLARRVWNAALDALSQMGR